MHLFSHTYASVFHFGAMLAMAFMSAWIGHRTLLHVVHSILNEKCAEFGDDTFNATGLCCFKQYLSLYNVMRIHQVGLVYDNDFYHYLNSNLVCNVRKLHNTASYKISIIAQKRTSDEFCFQIAGI